MDIFPKQKRSQIMSRIRSKHTRPEIAVRRVLKAKGIGYRLHYGKEKIDIALPSSKIAIFVDGCFWHKCPNHFKSPLSNKRYWLPKLDRNVKRDRLKNRRLRMKGWTVIRVWEHEIKGGRLPKRLLSRLAR